MKSSRCFAIVVTLLAMDLATNAYCQETVSAEQRGFAPDIMKKEAVQSGDMSPEELPPKSNPAVDETSLATAKPDYPLPLSSAEMAEREWLARKEARRLGFIVFLLCAFAFLVLLHALPHLLSKRKRQASKAAVYDRSGLR